MAVAVIHRAPLGVGQDLMGLRDVLELLLGLRILAVHVRMELARDAAKGALDLGRLGIAGEPEHVVGVAPHA